MSSISQCFLLDIDWAAWSAIATFIAAAVALYVGIRPLAIARKAHRLRAYAMARVLLSSLNIQGLHVAATLKVMRSPLTPALYNAAVDNVKVIDIELCRSFIQYLDAFPESTALVTGECLAQMDLILRSQKRLCVAQEGEEVIGEEFCPLYEDFLQIIDLLREDLAKQIGALPVMHYEPAASGLALQLRAISEGQPAVIIPREAYDEDYRDERHG